MPHAPTPWIGLAALVAMFVLPFLPDWLFEGPRTVRHRPRRHVCAACDAPWTERHVCAHEHYKAEPPARGELRRLDLPEAPIRNLPAARRLAVSTERSEMARISEPPRHTE
jgi:hypothetical protein